MITYVCNIYIYMYEGMNYNNLKARRHNGLGIEKLRSVEFDEMCLSTQHHMHKYTCVYLDLYIHRYCSVDYVYIYIYHMNIY